MNEPVPYRTTLCSLVWSKRTETAGQRFAQTLSQAAGILQASPMVSILTSTLNLWMVEDTQDAGQTPSTTQTVSVPLPFRVWELR